MDLLSFPMRLRADGSFMAVTQSGEDQQAESIASFFLTVQGERPLSLAYGSADPAFGWFEPGEITAGLAVYYPEINITDLVSTYDQGALSTIEVGFNAES